MNLDTMINLANIFNTTFYINKIDTGYLVSLRQISYKQDSYDIMARGLVGRGSSLESACSEYLNVAKGRILFRDDQPQEKRKEYICV